jgi:hypothetical protein
MFNANSLKQQQLFILPNIAGNEGQIEGHDQDHTEGR